MLAFSSSTVVQAAEEKKDAAPTVLFVQNAEGMTYDKAFQGMLKQKRANDAEARRWLVSYSAKVP